MVCVHMSSVQWPCMVCVYVSSAVAMPEILNCSETRYGVDSRVSRFVVPIAASLNRDGSAMFIALTSTYMAQISGATGADSIILIT